MKQGVKRVVRFALVGYWIALLTATHLPPRHLPDTHVSDKLEHFTAYGVLAGLLCAAMLARAPL